ncbi:MAG TPA: type II toxin-antitoxin system VapC family toxin [Nitrospirales bacterium]
MIRLVVDASVAVKWLVPESHAEAAGRILTSNYELLAPDLIWAEVGNVIWKKWRRREVSGEVAGDLLRDFHRYPLQTFASRALMIAAWDLAEQYDRTFYDSVYLALAVNAECPLITADLKLYNRLKAGALAERLVWVENIT